VYKSRWIQRAKMIDDNPGFSFIFLFKTSNCSHNMGVVMHNLYFNLVLHSQLLI